MHKEAREQPDLGIGKQANLVGGYRKEKQPKHRDGVFPGSSQEGIRPAKV